MSSTGIGSRCGSLVVIGYSKAQRGVRVCRCDCGHEITASAYALRSGEKVDCGRATGHRPRKPRAPRPVKDFKWQKVGRWRVLGQVARSPHGQRRWLCLCECGWWRVIDHSSLLASTSTSCGCHKAEVTRARMRTHGRTKSPEYISWLAMKRRCLNPKDSAYEYYGGRGITICERWLRFENFWADMGARPAGCSLDRIDSAGNYEPGNVRWATVTEQNNHLRTCRMITHDGETQSVAAWARELGLSYKKAYGWLVEQGLSIQDVKKRCETSPASIATQIGRRAGWGR